MTKPRKIHLTSKIKPSTKHALMAQLALAADEIIRLRSSPWQRFLAWWRA